MIAENFRYASSQSLNLPIPFEAGDILIIDCRLSAPPVTGILLEKDEGTNCSPQVLHWDPVFPDCWQKGPLEQGIRVMNAFGDVCTPILSGSWWKKSIHHDTKCLKTKLVSGMLEYE